MTKDAVRNDAQLGKKGLFTNKHVYLFKWNFLNEKKLILIKKFLLKFGFILVFDKTKDNL